MNELDPCQKCLSRREFNKLAVVTGVTFFAESILTACSTEYDAGGNLIWMPPVMDCYRETYTKAANKFEVSFAIPPIVTLIESGFYARADSGLAKGLMQISESTARTIANRIGISDYNLFDPTTNIMMGTFWLGELIDKHKDLPTAVCAYYSTNRQRCIDDNYIHWVMSMFNQRGHQKSDAFEAWMASQNGGDLRLAFEEQNRSKVLKISYSDWMQGNTDKIANCRVITRQEAQNLNSIHPGDTYDIEGDGKEAYVVMPSNNSSTIWQEELGNPEKAIFCNNFK